MKRYSDQELLALLNSPESNRVERKESFKKDSAVAKKVRQAICAFANDLPGHDQPGVIFIGANDNGDPVPLDVTDQLLRSLDDTRKDGNILPLPALTVEQRSLKGAALVVVTVMPSDSPPVRYKGQIYVRSGPQATIANMQDERMLNEKRKYKDTPFDIFPLLICRTSGC